MTGTAIVGTGFIGPIHVEALRRLGRPIIGILGSTPEKSRSTATALHIPRAYTSYPLLLADPEVQTVHITSPNRHHFDQCRQALAAGKHVICEKPLAMTSAESAELVELAARSQVVTAVCYNIRFYPLCLEAGERIAGGELGEIYHVTGSFTQDWLLYDTDFNWRVLADEGGSLRAVADIGTHWLDLIQNITGQKVAEVCADLHTVLPVRRRPKGSVETFQGKLGGTRETEPVTIDTEDCASVLLHFDRGARGGFTVSQVTAGRKNCVRFEIAGSRGAMAWNSERPNELWLGHRDRPNELLVRDPSLLHSSVRSSTDYPGGHNEGFPDTFKQLSRTIYEHIDDPGANALRLYPTFQDGHQEMLLCDAILRSQREKRWVKCA